MGPPSYPDLGKNARDVFGKGYHFGLLKLDLKTKTKSNVEFSSGGVSNQDSGKVFGSLETKYRVKEYGLTFSEKWNTDNTLATEIAIQDQIAQGLKLSFDTTFAPQTGKQTGGSGSQIGAIGSHDTSIPTRFVFPILPPPYGGVDFTSHQATYPSALNSDHISDIQLSKTGRIKSAFQNESVALNCDVDLNLSGPIVQASAVLGYNVNWVHFLANAPVVLSQTTQDGEIEVRISVGNDGQEFGGSIYQRVSPKLETGIQLAWTAGSNDTRFGIGAKYDLDKDAAVRAKVNNVSQIGLGYQQKLREGITLTLSALIDGKNFNQGGHKIGVALELEA
uniref:Voltage-dependent anion-selective channel n=1 Tax=Timema genevievae TaxID=629358 RepID=A0A7R9JWI3_TIMGE|nr:unnamed protein product [Timema genevievae]